MTPLMAKKPTASKRKSATPRAASRRRAAGSARKPARPRPAPTAAFYVTVSPLKVSIVRGDAKAPQASAAGDEFAHAKAAAIDALVAAIEDGERQLAALKRAAALSDLQALG
jgi:hypothetical protein